MVVTQPVVAETSTGRARRVAALSVAERVQAHQDVLNAANRSPQTTIRQDRAARRRAAGAPVAVAPIATPLDAAAQRRQQLSEAGFRGRATQRAEAWPTSVFNPRSPTYQEFESP